MHTLIPSAAGAPRCIGVAGSRQWLYRQHGSSRRHGDGLEAFARGRKRGTVTEEPAPSYPEPSEAGEGFRSSAGETQHLRTIQTLSALLAQRYHQAPLTPSPHEIDTMSLHEPSSGSREQDMKRRQHAGMRGLLDTLYDQDGQAQGTKQGGKQDSWGRHGASGTHVHNRQAVVRRQVQVETSTVQQPAASITTAHGAPEASPSANRLYTMMRKEGTSMTALLHFVLQHNDQLGVKHSVLAWKLAANILSQQRGSSADVQRSGSAISPAEAEALPRLVEVLNQRLSSSLEQLDARQTAITMWSMGSMELRDAALLPALLEHVRPMLEELGPCELSSVVWACAKLGLNDAGFLDDFEDAAIKVLTSFDAAAAPGARGSAPAGGNNRQYLEFMTENQQLCSISWSLAVLNRYNSSLFQALLSTYSRRFNTLEAPMLVTILWAMNKVGHPHPAFAHEALAYVRRAHVRTLKPNQLVMLVSYLMDLVEAGVQESGRGAVSSSSSSSLGSSMNLALPAGGDQGFARSTLQLAVAALQWKVGRRRCTALEAFTATEVVEAVRAVVILNQMTSTRPAPAVGGRVRDRRDSSSPLDRRFSPVVLAAYDDVLFLRLLLDRAMGLLSGFKTSELLQLLCMCARVGFTPKHFVRESTRLLREVKSSMSAEDLQVLSWAVASIGYED